MKTVNRFQTSKWTVSPTAPGPFFLPRPLPVLLNHLPRVLHTHFLMALKLTTSGAGPIGLVTALAAHAAGCTPIVLTDLVASRLEFAKTLLPNIRTVQIQKGTSPEDVAKMVKEQAGGMVNVALECTGFESSIRTAIFVSHLLQTQASGTGQ